MILDSGPYGNSMNLKKKAKIRNKIINQTLSF